MEKNAIVGRKAELDGIRNGLSAGGSAKGFLFTGKAGIGKSALLQESWREISQAGHPYIWIAPNFSTAFDEIQAATSLARGIDTSSADLRQGLSSFARAFGRKAFELERELTKSETIGDSSIGEILSEQWLANLFEALPQIQEKGGNGVTIVLAIDDLEKLPTKVINWLANDFFPKWNDAGMAERTRCIFAAEANPADEAEHLIQSACGNRVIKLKLRPLRSAECAEIASLLGSTAPDGENLRTLSGGNPGRLLQILKNAPTTGMNSDAPMNANEEQKASLSSLDGFSPEETEYLFRAAYLPVVSKDSLGLFCNPREASLSFNWIKNAGNLAEILPGNALALLQDVRDQALSLHARLRPEESAEWSSRAESHLAFEELFPNPRSRWIPIRLSSFQCFDTKVLTKLFGDDEGVSMIEFVGQNPEVFEDHLGFYKFRPEALGIVSRYKTLSSREEEDESLLALITETWVQRKSESESKRNDLEAERENIHSELTGIDKKIDTLNGLKENLLHSFLNPGSRKPRRNISLSVAPALVILGLTTIGVSLAFRDFLGPYHAAAGIALALFGFFWPSTKWQSQHQIAESGGMDRFAIETQQRMLGHKLMGLNTRKGRLRISIGEIDEGIEHLDLSLQQPYISNG
ncbi:MAG: ATP-binding protein [Verrucomicrobia bacterium]|nr:ATP-binding protein [Verrucomicrobiota bacterium]MDA1048772.1 ATP-binding protein [Verrucomicrobiota bacterium]